MAVLVSKVKKVSGEKKTIAHPPYAEMIKEAIVSLKERTGSSQIAIAKFIDDKHSKTLPANYKKLLLSQLKRLVASGSLVKVKSSFKLAASAKPAPKKKVDAKPQKVKIDGAKVTPVKVKKVVTKAKKVTPKKAKKPMLKSGTLAVVKAKNVAMKAKAAKKPKSVKSPGKKVVKKAKK